MSFTTPIEIGGKYKNIIVQPAWPDSFISEEFYKELGLTTIDTDIDVTAAKIQGTTLHYVGVARVSFSLCELMYKGEPKSVWFGHDFIICANIDTPVVLGRDFLVVNYLNISCGSDGVRRLIIPVESHQNSPSDQDTESDSE